MKRKWQAHLTGAEQRALARIEAQIEKREGDLKRLRQRRRIIQNRASVRAGGQRSEARAVSLLRRKRSARRLAWET